MKFARDSPRLSVHAYRIMSSGIPAPQCQESLRPALTGHCARSTAAKPTRRLKIWNLLVKTSSLMYRTSLRKSLAFRRFPPKAVPKPNCCHPGIGKRCCTLVLEGLAFCGLELDWV